MGAGLGRAGPEGDHVLLTAPELLAGGGSGDEGARLHGVAGQVPLALQRLQVIVDAVGGADVERLADLPYGRGIAAVLDLVSDESEHLELPVGERVHASSLNMSILMPRSDFKNSGAPVAATPGRPLASVG